MKALRILEAFLHSPARSFGSGLLSFMLFFNDDWLLMMCECVCVCEREGEREREV